MPTKREDLKNCFLVAFKAGVHGGLSYRHSDGKVFVKGSAEESSWKTDKLINDKDERNKAVCMASQIKRSVNKLGRENELGTIVPVENEEALDDLIEKCKQDVADFNATGVYTHLRFTALKFFISGENEVALEDMLGDLRETLDELRSAVKSADFQSIRSVVTKLKGFDMVLPKSAAEHLQRAIADARKQATDVRKSLEERGKDLEDVQREMNTTCVDFARFAVMDPSEALESDDFDNPLIKQMAEAHSESRGAGVMLGGGGGGMDEDLSAPFTGERYARQVMIL